MTIESPIIQFHRVSKSFGTQQVLFDLDLQIERGKTTAIIGRSGTGKSVLLKHIVGLIRPDVGEIYFEGNRIDQLSESALVPIRREIAFVFQLNALFDSLSVRENVAFPILENSKKRPTRKRVQELVDEALQLVGMTDAAEKRPGDLSGGEKKRVALARAIAIEPHPKVILYDEPTAGLDPQRADVINQLIQRLQDKFGVTGIVVTHDMHSAREIADRIMMLHNGQFIADGTAAEIGAHNDLTVRRFVEGKADPADLAGLR
ncbi:MAG: ABC transporter ATP-binding protein [Phycisphaerae bacterium]